VYVYRSYGIHWCFNIVCREEGHGAGVLVRALEPLHGLERMRERRKVADDRLLCAGPGRVGQALGIDLRHNRMAVHAPPFGLRPPDAPVEVRSGPRIGITRALEVPWRFGLAGSAFLSRPLP